jgi:hypothetical protein
LNSIGNASAQLFNRILGDATHLNVAGDILFGNMVSMLIDEALRTDGIRSYTYPNETVAEAITNGKFLLPSPFEYAFPNPELEG